MPIELRIKLPLTPTELAEVIGFLNHATSTVVFSTVVADQSQTAQEAMAAATSTLVPPAPSLNAAPPAPSVQTVAVQSASPAAVAEFDASGLPWDERIHSGKKSKTEAGMWRTRKGCLPVIVTAVTDELRQHYPVPVLSIAPGQPQQPAIAPPPPPVATTAAVPAPPAPVAAQPASPAPPPAATAPSPKNFATLLSAISRASMADQAGTQAKMNAALTELGYPPNSTIQVVFGNAAIIEAVWAKMGLPE